MIKNCPVSWRTGTDPRIIKKETGHLTAFLRERD
jgi:hypothetical protein